MIQLLDIMDRRFLTKVESNGFETNAKILQYIEEHPEEVNTVDKNGYTPYHWILRFARYPASLLTYILPYVADPNIPRVTTVLGRKESPILLLCQNTKRLQSMNTVLYVYKQQGKELTIGGKETGEFQTICDRDEKIYREPFVNSPFPLHEEPAVNQPRDNRVRTPALSNQSNLTRKQKNVGFRPLHIGVNGTKTPFNNIVERNVPLPPSPPISNQTRRPRRGAIVSSIFHPSLETSIVNSRSSRANSTNSTKSYRPSNWMRLSIANPSEIHVPTVNTSQTSSHGLNPMHPSIHLNESPTNTVVDGRESVNPILSAVVVNPNITTSNASSTLIANEVKVASVGNEFITPEPNTPPSPILRPGAGVGNLLPPATLTSRNSHFTLEPNSAASRLTRREKQQQAALAALQAVRVVEVKPTLTEEEKEIIKTTTENIAKIKGIILPRLKLFIKTGLCKTIPATYSGIFPRKLVTPEKYVIKTPDEILDAAIQFILNTLGKMSEITGLYPDIKISFPTLGYSNTLIWAALPGAAALKAQMKKDGRVSIITSTIDSILKSKTFNINCTKEELDNTTVNAIVKEVLQRLFTFIDPDIFDMRKMCRNSTVEHNNMRQIRYFMIKILNPRWSTTIKSKQLLQSTLAKKKNIQRRKSDGKPLTNEETYLLTTPNDRAILTPEQDDIYWLILTTANKELKELQKEYS
jgi:hypothetical protein